MDNRLDGFYKTFALNLAQNRFAVLEVVRSLLKSRHVDLGCVFEILSKSDDGCLNFNIGNVAIQFVCGFGVWSESNDVVQLTIELQNDEMEKVVGYEYELKELEILKRKYSKTAL